MAGQQVPLLTSVEAIGFACSLAIQVGGSPAHLLTGDGADCHTHVSGRAVVAVGQGGRFHHVLHIVAQGAGQLGRGQARLARTGRGDAQALKLVQLHRSHSRLSNLSSAQKQ